MSDNNAKNTDQDKWKKFDENLEEVSSKIEATTETTAEATSGKKAPGLSHPSHEELEDLLAAAEAKANENLEKFMRSQAEMDNLRRRMERDLAQAHKFAVERFIRELLPVADNLERSLEQKENTDLATLTTGVELTLKLLQGALEKFAVTSINPVGEAFNPALHEAMSAQESNEHAPNTVTTVLQKGYQLHDRLVRPALVVVTKAPQN